jgi:2,5-diketo-D-gluconate reductase A
LTNVPTIQLNDGTRIPQLGFGVFKVDPDDTAEAVKTALDIGYRHIDTAEMYQNERGVGQGVRAAWQTLEEFKKDGRARSIGVSNFQTAHLERLARETDTTPAVNQIEVHPYFTNDAVRIYGAEHGIATEAWSPIAKGGVLDDPVVQRIADATEKSTAQVVLRWHIQRGDIVFPKSVTPQRIRENFALFDFQLGDSDMEALTSLDKGEDGRTGPNPDRFDYISS